MIRKVLVVAVLVFLAPAVAASDVSFTTTEGGELAQDVTIDVRDGSVDADFTFRRVVPTGTNTLKSFSTDVQGRAAFTVSLDPFGRTNYIQGEGYNYQVRFSNGTLHENITVYYGFDMHRLDTFFDGVQNVDVYRNEQNDSAFIDEENGVVTFLEQSNTGDHNGPFFFHGNRFDEAVAVDINVSDTSGSFGSGIEFDFRNSSQGGSPGSPVSSCEIATEKSGGGVFRDVYHVWINESAHPDEFVVEGRNHSGFDCGADASGFVDTWWLSVSGTVQTTGGPGEDNQTMTQLFGYSVIPRASLDAFPQENGDTNAMGGDRFYSWNDFVLEGTPNLPALSFSSGGGFEDFFADLFDSPTLQTRNTDNDTVTAYRVSADGVEVLTPVEPEDGDVFEAGDTVDYIVEYNLPTVYDSGRILLQFDTDNDGTFDQTRTANTVEDLDGSCIEGFQRVTDACIGHRIAFRDVQLIEQGLPGTTDTVDFVNGGVGMRYEYTNEEAEINALEGDVFTSDTTTIKFSQQFKDITPISPGDGITFTTIDIPFAFALDTEVSGTAELLVNSSVQKQWSIGGDTDTTLNETVKGLSEGPHDWFARFDANDGETITTELRNFTINTTKANAVNITLQSPADGATRTDPDVTLQYDVDVASSGNALVFVNGDLKDNKTLSSGDNSLLNTSLIQLDADTYVWSVAFNDGDATIADGGSRSFTVTENVTLESVAPADGANIDTVPVVFKCSIDTNYAGDLIVEQDGENVASTFIEAGTDTTESFTVNTSTSGKHSYLCKFVVQQSKNVITTAPQTFTVTQGALEAPEAEAFGETAGVFVADVLGVSEETGLAFVGILIVVLFGLIAFLVTDDSPVTLVIMLIVYAGMVLAQWVPAWTVLLIIVPTGLMVSKKVVGGD